jgi:hypothetical protein
MNMQAAFRGYRQFILILNRFADFGDCINSFGFGSENGRREFDAAVFVRRGGRWVGIDRCICMNKPMLVQSLIDLDVGCN